MTKRILPQSRAVVYNDLVKRWNDFYKEEPQKLILYLHEKHNMDAESIGEILGVTGQSIRDKYLRKESK